MKNLIIAWRNLWRNRRRTLITSASIFFAVIFALFFRSLQLGSYDHMFRNAIESYTGYIQVQHQDFWDEKIVDNTFPYDSRLDEEIIADPNVIATVPRFESFALASNGPQTKGVLVMGIEPDKENYLSKISDKMVKYRLTPDAIDRINSDPNLPEKVKELAGLFENTSYTSASRLQLDLGIPDKDAQDLMPAIERHSQFENGFIRKGEPGVWVGDRLSQYLELGIGDTIVLISQGYHATTAAGKYEIKGIVKLPLPDIDNKIVYLPLDICQNLFNAEGNLTSLALHVNNNEDKAILETVERINKVIPESQRIMEWKEMNELLISQMDADNKSGMIMIGILYLVIAFGVFGTVLMMTAERRREFGVLVAIGMQKRKLASIITIEMLYVGFLGILAGCAVAIPAILYGVAHPIIFKGEFAKIFDDYGMEPMMVFQGIDLYFLWQMFIVALMVFLAIGYPVRKILGLQVVNALRA
ncbi:MAG: ABC transporter permease [Bacteroidales bacterium]|nr:ABC transporter permease [Bacteroidales bacterium]